MNCLDAATGGHATPISSARCSPSIRSFTRESTDSGSSASSSCAAEEEGRVVLERSTDGSYGVRLARTGSAEPLDAKALGLPTTESAIESYLANRYKGVGIKTAARLVQSFGVEVFQVLDREPERVRKLLLPSRADSVLSAWSNDVGRRATRARANASAPKPAASSASSADRSPAPPGDLEADREGARSGAPIAGTESVEDAARASKPPQRTGLVGRLLGRRRRGREMSLIEVPTQMDRTRPVTNDLWVRFG